MHTARPLRSFVLAPIVTLALLSTLLCTQRSASAEPVLAAAQSAATENSTELNQILFLQILPPPKGLKNGKESFSLSWIPTPIQRYCLGKPFEACSSMDYCLRTTNRNVSMCKNLGSALTHMPAYPRAMTPRRMLSVVLFPPSTMQGFDLLQKLAATIPHTTPQIFSLNARVKARVRLTQKPDDDDLTILEILAIAPF
jgi:hypothetical protein